MQFEFNFNESGVIPYRKKDGKLEVLLITSIKKKKWIIPKGYVEFNLTPFESAKKEAYEEAGVLGTNETHELGSFQIEKSAGRIQMKIFSMEVTEILDDFPEKDLRQRKWFDLENAAKNINIPEISAMILKMKEKGKL